MRCPDCQTEIPDRSAVCPNCHAVLEEAPVVETGLDDLWEQSEVGVMTSAKPTREVDAAAAREAVARARRSQPSARTPRAPSTPSAPRTPSTPATPPVPPPRRGPRPSSGSTGPHPRIGPPPTGPLPSLGPTGPVASAAPEPAAAPVGRSFGPASQAQISTHIVSADPEAQRGTQIVDLSLPPVVRQLAASKKAKDREEARSAKAPPGKPGIGVEESRVTQGIDEVMASLSLLYARMHRIDRWTLVALAVAFVGAFLPWRNVRGEGLLAGIQDYGAISVGVSLLTFFCIYARTVRRRLAGLVIVLQLLIAAGLTAVPVLRFMLAGGESDLSVGLYISGAGGVAVEVLTLMRLARLSS